jgi:hypothetical protein
VSPSAVILVDKGHRAASLFWGAGSKGTSQRPTPWESIRRAQEGKDKKKKDAGEEGLMNQTQPGLGCIEA